MSQYQSSTVAPSRGLSIASLVVALASVLFGWTFIAPIAAFVLGIMGLRREPEGRGLAWAGIVVSALVLFGWVLIALAFAFGAVALPFLFFV
ncbi:DUF4190 domain-containing protein [Arenivirga flava]|uniref:DUF4190 domain-containing protein n=1 Tax=Arenivirga flava TaxID=1930060 RepID=A0AA37XC54_9MICO|nr:DUF4190 domain-containing protein [Arenivirga flava]GMA29310.1 hypothetical protein GCM10025874_25630 [Arenivirga flava]